MKVAFTGAVNAAGQGEYVVTNKEGAKTVWLAPRGEYQSRESLDAAVQAVKRKKPRLRLIQGGKS